jgi:1-acyl-sn-glycerol-3-phosphate acyltransferase
MLYRLIKVIVGIGIRFYYQEVKVLNRKSLVHDGPLIIIANHPNTLMDAMMIGYACKQPIYYMAKGTLFNSKFKLRILQSLNMIPINRLGDTATKGVSNHGSFEACYKILEAGKTLVIFPEGTSFLERHLRELKPGTARIALEAEKRNQGALNLRVVPLGLNYLKADKFRSSVLIKVGQQISVVDHLANFALDSGKSAKSLTEKFRINLERVLVNSASKEQEELVDNLSDLLASKYIKTDESGVEGDINFLKEIRNRMDEIQLVEPWKIEDIQLALQNIQWRIRKLDIRADFLDRRFRSRMFFRQMIFSVLMLIVGLPIFLFGVVHNYIQFVLIDKITSIITKDKEYFAPIAVLLGLFFYPLFYTFFLLAGAIFFSFGYIGQLFYFLSMPITGMFAFSFSRYLQHISYKWKYIFLMINDKKAMLELQEKRNELRKMIFNS